MHDSDEFLFTHVKSTNVAINLTYNLINFKFSVEKGLFVFAKKKLFPEHAAKIEI
jgi:hypothetical protein